MSNLVFVDTWAWIALASANDQYHAEATSQHRLFRKQRREYVTTNLVLSELITHLYRRQPAVQAEVFIEGLRKSAQEGAHQIVFLSPDQFERSWLLRKKYQDKPDISFVDFTSMIVMRDLAITDVFSGDAHFEQVAMGFRLLP